MMILRTDVQEATKVDEAFVTIARAALQQEADTELYKVIITGSLLFYR